MAAPTVTAIIPCYNGARFVRDALDSVFAQTHQPDDILFIDDGSTDDSAAIAESFGERVTVIRQQNQGQSKARNRGLEQAQTDWVAFLDADDRWEPNKLELQLRAIQDRVDVVCAFTETYRFYDDVKEFADVQHDYHRMPTYRVHMLKDGGANSSNALCRTDVARRVRFPDGYSNSEDLFFYLQLREYGPFIRIPAPLTGYRISHFQWTQQPGFNLASVKSRFSWVNSNSDLYTADDRIEVRRLLADDLHRAHDMAFWNRDHAIVRQCREFFAELSPTDMKKPSSFDWPLYPRLLLQLKDQLDYLIKPRAKQ